MKCLFEIENIFEFDGCSEHAGTLIMVDGSVRKYNLSKFNRPKSSLYIKIKYSVVVSYLPTTKMNQLLRLKQIIRLDTLIQMLKTDNKITSYYYYDNTTLLDRYNPFSISTGQKRFLLGSTVAYHPNLHTKKLVKTLSEYTGEPTIYVL